MTRFDIPVGGVVSFKAVETDRDAPPGVICAGCCLNDLPGACCVNFPCLPYEREDGKRVYFKVLRGMFEDGE